MDDIFSQELGEGRDYLPQYPIRYQIGLKSGHTLLDHCGLTEKETIELHFQRGDKGFKKTKVPIASTYCLRGRQDYAIRANQLAYWMEIGAEVMIQPFSSLKKIELGIEGNQTLTLWVSMFVYRSLMDMFIPREIKVNDQFKQAQPIGSSMRFRLYSDDQEEEAKIEWKESIYFVGFWWDGKYHRRVRCAFKTRDFIFISQKGGEQWY